MQEQSGLSNRESSKTEFPLAGAGGEKVDLQRTFLSHGVASLPPMQIDEDAGILEATLPVDGSRPRTVRVRSSGPGFGSVEVIGESPGDEDFNKLLAGVRHVLRLDEDLSGFYEMIANDPELSWAVRGAGRMIRSATVFEDVVKTVCTTNCTWSATIRMVNALVEHLGERAEGAPPNSPYGRTFPTPGTMAGAGENFYRDVARAGYRGKYLLSLANSVAGGELDLESLGNAPRSDLSDEELERRLLALPGVGPYAAAHIMMLLGRHSRLILDSWTRPTYARVSEQEDATDAEIKRRFSGYGDHAGLAFWLYITRDWTGESEDSS